MFSNSNFSVEFIFSTSLFSGWESVPCFEPEVCSGGGQDRQWDTSTLTPTLLWQPPPEVVLQGENIIIFTKICFVIKVQELFGEYFFLAAKDAPRMKRLFSSRLQLWCISVPETRTYWNMYCIFSNQWHASESYMLFSLFCIAYSTTGETFEKEIILAHMDKNWNTKTTALYREPHQEAF